MNDTNAKSRIIQYMNQWFLSFQKGIKTIKYWNYRLNKHGIQLAKRLSKCICQPLFFIRLLIWVIFSRVIIQIKIRQKYDTKESHCINVLSKHFPRLNHIVETWLTNFVIGKVHDLSIEFLSIICHFVISGCGVSKKSGVSTGF